MTETKRIPRISAVAVSHITPVDGWTLLEIREYGLRLPAEYFARSAEEDRVAHFSRWAFTPTQERWTWYVRAGLPGPVKRPGGCSTPWTDDDIDAAIAERRAAA